MQYIKLMGIILLGFSFFQPLLALKPMEINVALEEENTPEDAGESSNREAEISKESVDETEVPYEDFNAHAQEEIETPREPESEMTLSAAVSTPVASNALLSLETTGSIFDQFADLERSKMLMTLQTEEEQMQLERDQVRLKRLKLQKELAEFENTGEESDSEEVAQEEKSDETTEESEAIKTPKTFIEKYVIKGIMGIGKNLVAILENTENETKTRVKLGTEIEGYTVRKIQPQKGIVFEKDGKEEELNIQ